MKVSPTTQDESQEQVPPNGFSGMVRLLIPAYTVNIKGLMINIAILVKKNDRLEVISDGNIAKSLEHIFKRNIDILSDLKSSYNMLQHFQYKLVSMEQGVNVKDVRSAGLPISIALLNVLRLVSGKKINQSIVGTGILRVDGSFSSSNYEHIKQSAAKQSNNQLEFADSRLCNHVFELEKILDKCE